MICKNFRAGASILQSRAKIPALLAIHVTEGRMLATDLDVWIQADTSLESGSYDKKGMRLSTYLGDDVSSQFPVRQWQESFSIGDLCDSFERIKSAISTEETRYYLNGAFLEQEEKSGRVFLTATDGHRLMNYKAASLPDGTVKNCIIPRQTIAAILKIGGDGWTIRQSECAKWIQFTRPADNVVITSRLIDGAYPDYRRAIPKAPFESTLSCDAKDLLKAIEPFVRIKSPVKITGESMTGHVVDYEPINAAWPGIRQDKSLNGVDSFGLNAKYLRDVASAAKISGGSMTLHVSAPSNPLLATFADENLTGVIMPLCI